MKAKTKQKIAKWFAALVVLVMIFQVLMPLFTSGVIGKSALGANVTEANSTAPAVKIGEEVQQVSSPSNEQAAKPVEVTAKPSK